MPKLVAAGVIVVVVLAAGAAASFPLWKDWLWPASVDAAKDDHPHAADAPQRVRIGPQARANMGLKVQAVEPAQEPYWRALNVSGLVVEHQGSCERLVTAPMGGVVRSVGAVRGDLVYAGDLLFTLDLVSEPLHASQAELYKTKTDWGLAVAEKKRLLDPFNAGAIPMSRMIEVENNVQRLAAAVKALEHELSARGLNAEQIKDIGAGRFVRTMNLTAPAFTRGELNPLAAAGAPASILAEEQAAGPLHGHASVYEMEDLKVLLGEHVQPGQALCLLADHNVLHIEGRVFPAEVPWIQQAVYKGWTVRADFPAEIDKAWPSLTGELKISYLANRVDPLNQTLNFYLPLPNRFLEYSRDGKTYRLWRFRPGQRVTLRVPVESFSDVFVLPADAVARQGPETFVFRENGDFFERLPVHVLFEDRTVAVIANDGSILPGAVLAQSAAAQLNWALKTQSEGEGGGHDHHHHDH